MEFEIIYKQLIKQFSESEIQKLDKIDELEKVTLEKSGSNDKDGFQVFTPKFIVENMADVIGINNIVNLDNKILEPTSGDGAFTTYILNERLKSITKDRNNIQINALKCLATIYSVEMDAELIKKQRNNVYTTFCNFMEKHKFTISKNEAYFNVVKCIIFKNFVWGMFNSENPIGLLITEVVYSMPEAEKGNLKAVEFAAWNICPDSVSFSMEGVEL